MFWQQAEEDVDSSRRELVQALFGGLMANTQPEQVKVTLCTP